MASKHSPPRRRERKGGAENLELGHYPNRALMQLGGTRILRVITGGTAVPPSDRAVAKDARAYHARLFMSTHFTGESRAVGNGNLTVLALLLPCCLWISERREHRLPENTHGAARLPRAAPIKKGK